MSAPLGASMAQGLRFGWTVLRASRTAFFGQAATLFWTLGFGLLIFLVSSESSSLGLETKTEQVIFLAMVWGPMTLGFLVAHGLRALSKPASMALLPTLKGRATQAVLGFAVLAALLGAAAAGLLQGYGVLNGAIFALGSYIVVLGLVIPGRPDVHALILIVVVGILGRSEIVSIAQGTEAPSLGQSLIALVVFLLGIPAALWLFRPRENAVLEGRKQGSSRAQRAGPVNDELAPLGRAPADVRLRRATHFAWQSPGQSLRLKAGATMMMVVSAQILLVHAFTYFFKGGNTPSPEVTCQLLFLTLMFPTLGSTSMHVGIPSAAFSRATLAEHSYRRLLWFASAWVAALIAMACVLAGVLAIVRGGDSLDWVYLLPVASLYVLPVLPWAIALGLLVQQSGFVRRWSIPGLEMLCAAAGVAVANTVMVPVALAATKHVASQLGAGAPSMALSMALWVVGGATMASGLVALRLAFRRYYASASLEPAA